MFSPSALRATLCISECIVCEEIKPKKKKKKKKIPDSARAASASPAGQLICFVKFVNNQMINK